MRGPLGVGGAGCAALTVLPFSAPPTMPASRTFIPGRREIEAYGWGGGQKEGNESVSSLVF